MPNEKSHPIRTEEEEKFEDTKGVRNRKSKIIKGSETVIEEGYTTQWSTKKDKRTNNDLQNITDKQKTID
jgi:riboflavin biosynthesis pyrimidine reductase